MATIWLNPNCSAQTEWEVRQEARRDGDDVMPRSVFPWNRAEYRAIAKRARPPVASGQHELPQCAPDLAGLARHRAAAPLRPRKPQAPCDVGLFGDTDRQADLVDQARALERRS